MRSYFVQGSLLNKKSYHKNVIVASVLVLNTFSWLYLTLAILNTFSESAFKTDVLTYFYLFISISSVLGVFLSRRIKRLKFLCLWVSLGAAISFLSAFISFQGCVSYVLSSLLGLAVGVGMPSCLAFYADCTSIENRGKISGITLCATNLIVFPLSSLTMFLSQDLSFIFSGTWRLFILIIIIILKPRDIHYSKNSISKSIAELIKQRRFILYFTPWILFLFVDRICGALLERPLLEAVFGSLSSLIAGYLADNFGRKRTVICGFIGLGIAYGVFSLTPDSMLARYFHFIIDGISAGILFVAFTLILWADLSRHELREEAYMIGNILFFPTRILTIMLPLYVTFPPVNAIFSLASFFLFLAVIPLMYAPETLPEKLIRRRELEKYVEKAKKIREKYEKQKED